MKAPELKWSKAALVAEIERLRDREDALTETTIARETELHAVVGERARLKLVVAEQLAEIQRLQKMADALDDRLEGVRHRIESWRASNPLGWTQVLELVRAAVGAAK